MRSKLFILLALACACSMAACVQWSPSETKREHVSSRFDRPAHHFIYVGMSREDLLTLMGQPRHIGGKEGGEIWYYDFGVVVLQDAQVKYRYPPVSGSRSPNSPHRQGRSDQH